METMAMCRTEGCLRRRRQTSSYAVHQAKLSMALRYAGGERRRAPDSPKKLTRTSDLEDRKLPVCSGSKPHL